MVVVIQRVKKANCIVNDKIISEIDKGIVLLIGFSKDDEIYKCEKIAKKILNLRIFEDENKKMNKNICAVEGSILAISQFTLTADINNGNRPSFDSCMEPNKAKVLYDYFVNYLKCQNIIVKTGIFGAYMQINISNDGPVTFVLNS